MRTLTALGFCLLSSLSLADECVILLHGLAKTSMSMSKIEHVLTQRGYHVINVDYPSREAPIEQLAPSVIAPAVERCEARNTGKINFVTHSMGGILVRQYLLTHSVANLKRVVMLAPPNGGSPLADILGQHPSLFRWSGPASRELGAGPDSVPNRLGPVDYDVGVIAGNHSVNPILSTFLVGQDDGKVTVQATRVAGMRDHIVMPTSHVFIMKNRAVINQIAWYLEQGSFSY